MKNKRKPHFLEVFLPNLSSNRLKVPSKFVEHLEDRISDSLSLIGPSGNIWHVNLLEYNGHLYFHDGWATFVKDHFLQCGDTLIFGYEGNSNFTVQIFDESSCEKDKAFNANSSRGDSECHESLGKKRGRGEENSMLTIVAEKKARGSWDSWDFEPINVDLSAGSEDMHIKDIQEYKETLTSTKTILKASDRMVVLAIPAQTKSQRMSSLVNSQARKIVSKVKKAWKKKQSKKTKASKKTKTSKQIKPKTRPQKTTNMSKLLESSAARYFTSSFPYFVRIMCYSNISGNGTMKIPMHFSTVHFPNCKFQVTLKNLSGDRWTVNTIPTVKRNSTMLAFCGGWLAFVRANSIKIEDVCIFELVSKFEMRVRILRLGMEGLDCQAGNSIVDADGLGSSERSLEMVDHLGVQPSNDLDQNNAICTYNNESHEQITKMPDMLHVIEPSIELGEDSIAFQGPACASASSNAIVDESAAGDLGACTAERIYPYQRSRKKRNYEDFQVSNTMHMKPAVEIAEAALSFTSPFPSFTKVMSSSNVGKKFSMNVPNKFSAAHLPCYTTEIVLRNLRGDSWNVVAARYGQQTKFCRGWMSFACTNNVKIGDTCIFELLDEKVLQVHVFGNSQKEQECLKTEGVADDLTTSVELAQFGVLPEA